MCVFINRSEGFAPFLIIKKETAVRKGVQMKQCHFKQIVFFFFSVHIGQA